MLSCVHVHLVDVTLPLQRDRVKKASYPPDETLGAEAKRENDHRGVDKKKVPV
ncbi:hypothetical protein vfu_B00835 [Vibrio furnissii NCTC 11218]|nr:hypothetical protein vfu_B00835 [Vibrio furnissii NCTC 11218]